VYRETCPAKKTLMEIQATTVYVTATFALSSEISKKVMCFVADQTCKNMPTIMQTVADVRNIAGICHVMI